MFPPPPGDDDRFDLAPPPTHQLDPRIGPASVQRSFGMPVGVSRLVDLPRAPTDREWGQMVSEFRTIFGVQGTVTVSGALREWSHGNLHISVEPTARGDQLRLSTLRWDAVAVNTIGFICSALAVGAATVAAATGHGARALIPPVMFGGMATIAFFGATLFRQPLWARERERQMGEIAERAVELLSNY